MSDTNQNNQGGQANHGNSINQIVALLFALCLGIMLGSLDEIRDKLPWRKHVEPEVVYVPVTPAPAPETPAPPGAWMRDKERTTRLDHPTYNRTTGPGAAVRYPQPTPYR